MSYVAPFCFLMNLLITTAQVTVPVQMQPFYQTNGYTQPNIYPNLPKNLCNQLYTPQNFQPSALNNHPYQQLISGINPNEIVKVIFNKVLTSPHVHKVDVPASNPDIKDAVKAVPHVVNNYFIVSPEYLKLNETIFNEKSSNNTVKHSKEKDVKVKKPKTSKKKYIEKVTKEKVIEEDLKSNKMKKVETKTNKKRKHSKNKESKEVCNEKENTKSDKISKNVEIIDTTIVNEHCRNNKILDSSKASKIIENLDKTIENKHCLKTNEFEACTHQLSPEDFIYEALKPKELTQFEGTELGPNYFEDIFNQIISSDVDLENRFTRNSKDDEIVKDVHNKFPEVPENIARSILQYVKSKLQNLPTATNYPFGYGFYQMPLNYNGANFRYEIHGKKRNNRRRKKTKKKHNKKQCIETDTENVVKNNESDTMCENYQQWEETEPEQTENSLTESIHNEDDNNMADVNTKPTNQEITETLKKRLKPEVKVETTVVDKQDLKEEVNPQSIIPQTPKEDAIKEAPKYEFESVSYKKSPTREKEDMTDVERYSEIKDLLSGDKEYLDLEEVPIINDNRLLEDYYSMYTDDPSSNIKYILQNFNDRHYYATDRTEREKKERYVPYHIIAETIPKLLRQHLKEAKHYKDIENRNLLNLLEEYKHIKPSIPQRIMPDTKPKRIEEFKTPPLLNFPDFITKKIDRNLRTEDNDDVENINYSDVRIKPVTKIERIIVPSNKKDIETVFANSKVIKYGGDADNGDTGSGKEYDDDQISYVTSKSVLFDDFW